MRKALVSLVVLFGALTLVPFFSSDAVAQGMKIGFVRDTRIYEEYKGWQKAQDDLNAEARAWEEEAVAKQDALRELQEEYERQKLILSDEKRREKEATITTKEEDLDAFTRRIYGPGGTAEQRQMALMQPVIDRITEAIEAIAVEGDYDVIFTAQSGLGYIKESYDITDKVLEYLEENE
jgi:outer membrane protein